MLGINMQKILTKILLLAFCSTSLFASEATKKKDDEQKWPASFKDLPKRMILRIEEVVVDKPGCKPEKLAHITDKEVLAAQQKLLTFYAPVAPIFSTMLKDPKKYGCFFKQYPAEKIDDKPASYSTRVGCTQCLFTETFIRAIPVGPPCSSCPSTMAGKGLRIMGPRDKNPEPKLLVWCGECTANVVIVNKKKEFTTCLACNGCGSVRINRTPELDPKNDDDEVVKV